MRVTFASRFDRPKNTAWARDVFDGMLRFSPGTPNLNFPGLGEDSEQVVRAAFGTHYARLVAVKTKYDPTNLFRLNQSIVPSRRCRRREYRTS